MLQLPVCFILISISLINLSAQIDRLIDSSTEIRFKEDGWMKGCSQSMSGSSCASVSGSANTQTLR